MPKRKRATLVDDPTPTVVHPTWCSLPNCWAYPASADEPPAGEEQRSGGCHVGTRVTLDVGRFAIGLQLELDNEQDRAPRILLVPEGFSEELPQLLNLELNDALKLRDLLDSLLGQAGQQTHTDEVVEAFRLGCEIYRGKYIRAAAAHGVTR